MKISNLRIGTRLALGFGTVCVFLAAVAAIGIWTARTINGNVAQIVDDQWPKTVLANEAIGLVNSHAINTLYVMSMEGNLALEAELKARSEQVTLNSRKLTIVYETLGKLVASEQGKALMKDILAKQTVYTDARRNALEVARNDGTKGYELMNGEVAKAQEAYLKAIASLVQHQGRGVENAGRSANAGYELALRLILALGGAALVLAALIGWLVTRSVTRPLARALEVAKTVSDGDLSSVIEADKKDETGQLLQALKDMNESLKRIVGEVRTASEAIGAASGEIATGNAELSSRTEEQASSLEETASSMEELTSTVKQNAENARQANQLATGASEVAVKGGQVVGEVVTTMNAISGASKKIADIIGVIDGIAFQTNILALNAAVEAARAGEQGRGFAVVATEVRSLAQRSAAAAKEIKELISDSVSKVESGSRLVNDAGRTMGEVVSAVKRVTDIMAEITAASQEQSAGIEQVNQAITQMDQVTQQNAALVEESAAAAESMKEQAQGLAQAVRVFKLEAAAQAAHVPAPAEASPAEQPAGSRRDRRFEGARDRRSAQRATNVTRLPASKALVAARGEAQAEKPAQARVAGSDTSLQEREEF